MENWQILSFGLLALFALLLVFGALKSTIMHLFGITDLIQAVSRIESQIKSISQKPDIAGSIQEIEKVLESFEDNAHMNYGLILDALAKIHITLENLSDLQGIDDETTQAIGRIEQTLHNMLASAADGDLDGFENVD